MPKAAYTDTDDYYKGVISKLPLQCRLIFKNHTRLLRFDGKKAEIQILREVIKPLILANLKHLHRAFPNNNGQGVIIRLIPPAQLKISS